MTLTRKIDRLTADNLLVAGCIGPEGACPFKNLKEWIQHQNSTMDRMKVDIVAECNNLNKEAFEAEKGVTARKIQQAKDLVGVQERSTRAQFDKVSQQFKDIQKQEKIDLEQQFNTIQKIIDNVKHTSDTNLENERTALRVKVGDTEAQLRTDLADLES